MGKSKKPKIEVTKYYLSSHLGICTEIDKLLSIVIKEKLAWAGEKASAGAISINQPNLFGGEKKEGGAVGSAYFLPGGSSQVLPDNLATKLGRSGGSDAPGYRGIASCFFYGTGTQGFYWTSNTPFLPGVWFKVRRAPVGLDPTYALIPRNASSSSVIVGYDAFWDYQELGSTLEPANYASIDIPEDGYDLNAQAAFGLDASGPFTPPRTINTAWAKDTSLWFRRVITLDEPSNLNLSGFIENGLVVWIDGQYLIHLEPANPSNRYGAYSIDTGILQAGVHILNVLATDEVEDYGGNDNTYFDMQITAEVADGYDANPAHIIYECLTNTTWGMGSPTSAIDYDSFDEASQTLFAENFGLSMLWSRQTEIQNFIQEVLDHIQAVIYVDPSTGLITLDLIRDDYDAGTLDVLDPDNADLTNFSRKLWGDIVNEITVTWTNPDNEQEETITAQDDASIAIQGGIVPDSRNYYGVRTAALAQDLAFRDLRSAGQPLASCEAEVDRSQYALRPASVIKLTWPEYGLTELVMRVQSVDYGKLGDPTIKLNLIEDVYGLDIGSYGDPPGTSWVDPSAQPSDMDPVEIITLPYFMAANSGLGEFIESPEYPEVISGILASTDNADTYEAELWDEVTLTNGDVEWQALSTLNVIGTQTLSEALVAEANSTNVPLATEDGRTQPVLAGFVILGDGAEATSEICMIDADNSDGTYTLVRGVMDTIPRAWPIGTRAWFVDESTLFEDLLVRSAAEVVDYKVLPSTSQGQLPLAAATLQTHTLTDRPWLPNRPGNVTAYDGTLFSSRSAPIDASDNVNAYITVSWAIRNRLDEDSQILSWDDATQTAETGQTTTIEVRDVDGALLATHDGLTGTTYNVPDSSYSGEQLIELRVYAERSDSDGDFVSLQYFSHWVLVAAATFDSELITFDTDSLTWDQN